MINLLACTRVHCGLPAGYCCVLYPLLVIHHLGTVSAMVSHSHMQRVEEGEAESKRRLQSQSVFL